MKRAFLISLLALMLLQAFSKVFIVLNYQLNKEYVVAFLCVNRDKPELQCQGKCHLKKELEKHDKANDQSDERRQKQELPMTLYCQALFRLPTHNVSHTASPPAPFRQGRPLKIAHAVFHPPRFAV